MSQPAIRCILTDIEGTTTSISFVHEVLFPYAYRALPGFLATHSAESAPFLAQTADTLRTEDGIASPTPAQCEAALLHWITTDRKHPALKALQGMIWRHGYEQAEYQGHVYDDVLPALQRWQAAGIRMAVYSSGSVAAQHLIFGYSTAGDLRPFFSGWFDTAVGHKRETASYATIARQLQLPAAEILFLSDVAEELDAAQAAGMQTAQLLRDDKATPGNHPGYPDFRTIVA